MTPFGTETKETPMQASALGLLTGLISGLSLAVGNFGDFLLVLFLGAVGFVVGRVLDGQLDLTQYLGGSRRPRR